MGSFKPSGDFVARTMEKVRSYEMARAGESEHPAAMSFSKPALWALSAGAVLIGMVNVLRTVWTLIAPAVCL